jgi:hypothetical protein
LEAFEAMKYPDVDTCPWKMREAFMQALIKYRAWRKKKNRMARESRRRNRR